MEEIKKNIYSQNGEDGLESKGFTKIGYKLWRNDGWCDALYVREI